MKNRVGDTSTYRSRDTWRVAYTNLYK